MCGIPDGEQHAGIDMMAVATAVFKEGGEEVDVKLIDVVLINVEVSCRVLQDGVRMAGVGAWFIVIVLVSKTLDTLFGFRLMGLRIVAADSVIIIAFAD